MKEEMDNLLATLRPLMDDASHCMDMLPQQDDQFWRRNYVRAVFAEIEGAIYCMKQVALASTVCASNTFSNAERFLLQEQSYDLSEKGEAQMQRMKISLL